MKKKKEKKRKNLLIKCLGRWANGRKIDCDFTHVGRYGDKELFEHYDYEMSLDDRKTIFYCGFETESWWYVQN